MFSDLGSDLRSAGRYLGQALRLMVGLPDYDTYVAHMRATHPDRDPMTYEEFFRERQNARYGSGAGKCC
ncbi:YbdD/YjiX family protein [Burkholderia lata]|uniref:YbdD/YjiX family protein n=1 Tax=Burkholderia lata (strain ATCC 17760 / DSM 23089 / LMG 22485 / NCIMB 9086 / R18194 / 383) TaxID=482957 RepID=UPI00399BCCAE